MILEQLFKNEGHFEIDERYIEELIKHPKIASFLKEHHLNKDDVKKNFPIFTFFAENYVECKGKGNLSVCKQKNIGQTYDLEYKDSIVSIILKPCCHFKKQNSEKAYLKQFLINDEPLAYQNIFLDDLNKVRDYSEEYQKLLEKVMKFYHEHKGKGNRGLYFRGQIGNGKTYLMSALANSLAKDNESVAFVSMPNLIYQFKVNMYDKQTHELIEKLKEIPYLFLDDIGREMVDAQAMNMFYILLNERINQNRLTFFTSEYTRDDKTVGLYAYYSDLKLNDALTHLIKTCTTQITVPPHPIKK